MKLMRGLRRKEIWADLYYSEKFITIKTDIPIQELNLYAK